MTVEDSGGVKSVCASLTVTSAGAMGSVPPKRAFMSLRVFMPAQSDWLVGEQVGPEV
jgi:hypothetical protein